MMFDHTFIRANGERVPVSQMTDEEIALCLREGVGIQYREPGCATPEANVMARLEIELLRRRLGL